MGISDLGNLGPWEFGILGIYSCNTSVAVAILVLQLQYLCCSYNTSVAVAILVLLGFPKDIKTSFYYKLYWQLQ